jgi:hypothetical protein
VGDVVGMMRSFQRMLEALISCLDQDEGRASVPIEGSQHTPAGSSSVHKEPKKVNFLELWGPMDSLATKAWLENMAVFQLKGSALVWWKTILPQLNMVIEDMSWELFKE